MSPTLKVKIQFGTSIYPWSQVWNSFINELPVLFNVDVLKTLQNVAGKGIEVLIIGHKGAGKSTLLNALSFVLRHPSEAFVAFAITCDDGSSCTLFETSYNLAPLLKSKPKITFIDTVGFSLTCDYMDENCNNSLSMLHYDSLYFKPDRMIDVAIGVFSAPSYNAAPSYANNLYKILGNYFVNKSRKCLEFSN